MSGKYAFVVAANSKYLPGLNAVLNSLDYCGNKHDVLLVEYKLPQSYLDAIQNAGFSFQVKVFPVEQKEVDWLGEAEVLMRKRYAIPHWINTVVNEPYDAVCILDADMFILRDLTRYLEIAHKAGLVLGNTLEQKRRYGDVNHQYPAGSGNYLIPPDFWNARDLACAPLFVGKKWYPALKKSYDLVNNHPHDQGRFKAPDMDALNICLLEAGSYERTIPLSQHTWTGLHESLMKAHTRAIEMHGHLFTEDGEEINVIHGQWWNKIWRGWQIENQLGMIGREFNRSESYKVRSIGSFQLVCEWWKKMACSHRVNINNFLDLIPSASPAKDVMDIT